MCVRTYLILEANLRSEAPVLLLASAYKIASTDMNACVGLARDISMLCDEM